MIPGSPIYPCRNGLSLTLLYCTLVIGGSEIEAEVERAQDAVAEKGRARWTTTRRESAAAVAPCFIFTRPHTFRYFKQVTDY
ncbi:unnamed protein product [Urochloa humidicola]